MRRSGALAAGILLAGGIAGGISPASADPGVVCAAAAQVIALSDGIYYPVVGPTLSGVTTAFTAGACEVEATLTSANCGNSVGSGTVTAGGHLHSFSLITAGGTIVVSGGANGSVNATPNVGQSCMFPGPGADSFIVSGMVTMT